MPSLFFIGGYRVFFWANENGEPVHVHVCKGKPSANATKLWLTAQGGCIIANNNGKIPPSDLNELMSIIAAQFPMICQKWREFFLMDDLNFYC